MEDSKIALDWNKLPKEAMWVATCQNGQLLWYAMKPRGTGHVSPYAMLFMDDTEESATLVPKYIPFTFSGDWKDSMTPRLEENDAVDSEFARKAQALFDSAFGSQPRKEEVPPAVGETLLAADLHMKLSLIQSERDRYKEILDALKVEIETWKEGYFIEIDGLEQTARELLAADDGHGYNFFTGMYHGYIRADINLHRIKQLLEEIKL